MQHRTAELRSLTALRFVAAFALFAFHIRIHFGPLDWITGAADRLVLNAAAFMSLFFVLSGFVLTYSYLSKPAELSTYIFWLNRDGGAVALCAAQIALIVVLSLTFVQAWFPPLMRFWNNGASWSLSVEAFFYALYPSILNCIKLASQRTLLLTLGLSLMLSVSPGLVYLAFGGPPIYYALPIFRLPEFLSGCAAGDKRERN